MLIGLMVAVVNFELDENWNIHDPNQEEWEAYPNPMENPRNSGYWINTVRSIVCFTSLIAVCCNYKRYKLKMKWLDLYYHNHHRNDDDIHDSYNEIMGG